MAATNNISFDNRVFSNFAFYSVLTIFKMFALPLVIGYLRATKNVFPNPEDVASFSKNKEAGQVSSSDPDVERARRSHLNDVENIPAFVLIGLFYVLTGPSPSVALWHFRVFACARLFHTLSYQFHVQPWRARCWAISVLVQVSMGTQVLLAAC